MKDTITIAWVLGLCLASFLVGSLWVIVRKPASNGRKVETIVSSGDRVFFLWVERDSNTGEFRSCFVPWADIIGGEQKSQYGPSRCTQWGETGGRQ